MFCIYSRKEYAMKRVMPLFLAVAYIAARHRDYGV